jgi:hypothetical protein
MRYLQENNLRNKRNMKSGNLPACMLHPQQIKTELDPVWYFGILCLEVLILVHKRQGV